jgi:hypothetical protein
MSTHLKRLLTGLAGAAALTGAVAAGAAIPPAGSVGPANPSVSWQGQRYTYSTLDPRYCTPQVIDPINLICDHFTLQVEAPGSVTATIAWPSPEADFDLYVCQLDPAADLAVEDACTGGREIARSDSLSGTSETATFDVPSAGLYELRVVPLIVSTPTAYTGSATYSGAPGPPSSGSCSPGTIHIVLAGLADVCVGLGVGLSIN